MSFSYCFQIFLLSRDYDDNNVVTTAAVVFVVNNDNDFDDDGDFIICAMMILSLFKLKLTQKSGILTKKIYTLVVLFILD